MKKVDQNGWEHYDKLPVEYRLATINDFHFNGRKKFGLEFLVKWADKEYYQVCIVNENLKSAWLKQFIDENRVFIKKQNNESLIKN